MRKATSTVIAGKPPAEGAQPSGIHGIMVNVANMEKQEPIAPRIPSFLFQNPKNKRAQISHSATPKNHVAPRMPRTGYIQEIRGPLLMKGISSCASYSNHF